jgi:hypothetical protein
MDATAIIGAVNGVTAKWAKQRRAEERERSRSLRRREALVRSHRVTIRDAAFDGMEAAYLKASTGGRYPAHARQIMYAARGPIQERTGRTLDDQYFCQTLLPDYLIENPDSTATWDVVFDARGHLVEPHTGRVVPLGTLDVRDYLGDAGRGLDLSGPKIDTTIPALLPTCGPEHRYSAILFIEKEGFMPLFAAAQLAERHDIAIMSTKGMSVTASRLLVDTLCGRHGIPLLVLRDFDKSGFSIIGTLQRDTRRYAFVNAINVTDLGLRLPDVRRWGLESEDVTYGKTDPSFNLRENGATEDEIAFLCDAERSSYWNFVGRRVELNAFPSGDMIMWIEDGLKRHGVKKVVPDTETLEAAFRRAAAGRIVAGRMREVVEQARAEAAKLKLPRSLGRQIKARLKEEPALPWDQAVSDLAARFVKSDDPDGGDSAS